MQNCQVVRLFAMCLLAAVAFETASVKLNKRIEGHDGTVVVDPIRFSARNIILKRLIHEAWQIPYSRILAVPVWIASAEFDIEAKAEPLSSSDRMHLILQALLAERFKLSIHLENRSSRVYYLLTAKGGARLNAARDNATWKFHGTLDEFADKLAVALAIPILDDPAVPSHPAGPAVPILNKTGLDGVCDIAVNFKPEPGGDIFTLWQRVLQEQLGLRLEAPTAPVEMLVLDHAEKPSVNSN